MFTRSTWFRASLALILVSAITSVAPPNAAKAGKPAPPPSYSYTVKLLPASDPAGNPVKMRDVRMNNHGDVLGQGYDGYRYLYTGDTNSWRRLDAILDEPNIIVSPPGALKGAQAPWRYLVTCLNDAGQMAGQLYGADSADGLQRSFAFRYTPATDMPPILEVLLDDLDENSPSYRYGGADVINQSGDVAGWLKLNAAANYSCYLWLSGQNPFAGTLGQSEAVPIPGAGSTRGINDFAQVVGRFNGNGLPEGYRFTPFSENLLIFGPLDPYGWYLDVYGINIRGDIVGSSSAPRTAMRAFKLLDGQQMVNLGNLDATAAQAPSLASSISPTGAIIVGIGSIAVKGKTYAEFRAFVYTDKMRDLSTVIDPSTIPVGMTAADFAEPDYPLRRIDNGQIGGVVPLGTFYSGTSGRYPGRVFVVTPK